MSLLLADIWIPAVRELGRFGPELAMVGTIVAVLVVPLIAGRGGQLAACVSLLGVLAAMAATRFVGSDATGQEVSGLSPPGATPMLLADSFSVFFKVFLLLFLALVIGLWLVGQVSGGRPRSRGTARVETRGSGGAPGGPEFFVLLLTSALGMVLMVGTLNLLVILIAIEMASLPSYAIVASDKRSRPGAEASLKYVLFGAASAAIMVYGASLLYGVFGTLDLPTIAGRLSDSGAEMTTVGWIGLCGLTVGIVFKIAAVPFHFWCPDVFEGAPTEVTTWLSVASKAAGLGLLMRIMHTFAAEPAAAALMTPFAWGIGLVAAVTCTVGNLSALRQESVKRMLAYSSIAHAGYMMMAAAILYRPADRGSIDIGLAAVVAYLLVYMIMNLGAFGVTAMVSWQTGSDRLSSFTGLGRRAPWLALPMAVCLFSLVGLPPLGGFAAKWWLLMALGQAAEGQAWLWGLVIVAVVNTVISLYYYVRIIRRMYVADDEGQPAIEVPLGGLAMVNGCAVALLLLGTLLFNPLGERARTYASDLSPAKAVASSVDAVTSERSF